jgi:hypothetical protein
MNTYPNPSANAYRKTIINAYPNPNMNAILIPIWMHIKIITWIFIKEQNAYKRDPNSYYDRVNLTPQKITHKEIVLI